MIRKKDYWPVFRSAAHQEDASGSSSLFVTKPTGVASGDVLVAFLYSRNTTAVSSINGFSTVYSGIPTLDGTSHRVWCGIKVAGGGEPASYEWQFGSGSDNKGGVILAYTNGHATQNEAVGNALLTASSTQHQMPTMTPTYTDSMQISCWFLDAIGGGAIGTVATPPPGATLRYASPNGGFGGRSDDFFTVYEQQLGPASVASGTRNLFSGNACGSYGITTAIRRS